MPLTTGQKTSRTLLAVNALDLSKRGQCLQSVTQHDSVEVRGGKLDIDVTLPGNVTSATAKIVPRHHTVVDPASLIHLNSECNWNAHDWSSADLRPDTKGSKHCPEAISELSICKEAAQSLGLTTMLGDHLVSTTPIPLQEIGIAVTWGSSSGTPCWRNWMGQVHTGFWAAGGSMDAARHWSMAGCSAGSCTHQWLFGWSLERRVCGAFGESCRGGFEMLAMCSWRRLSRSEERAGWREQDLLD